MIRTERPGRGRSGGRGRVRRCGTLVTRRNRLIPRRGSRNRWIRSNAGAASSAADHPRVGHVVVRAGPADGRAARGDDVARPVRRVTERHRDDEAIRRRPDHDRCGVRPAGLPALVVDDSPQTEPAGPGERAEDRVRHGDHAARWARAGGMAWVRSFVRSWSASGMRTVYVFEATSRRRRPHPGGPANAR